MNILIALGAVAIALVARLATTPTSADRDAVRRARLVARRPALANLGDVRVRLAAELPIHTAAFVMQRVQVSRIDAQTLWAWLERFDAESLVLALAVGHRRAGLMRILSDEKPYDVDEARVLACLSAPEVFDLAVSDRVARPSTSGTRR